MISYKKLNNLNINPIPNGWAICDGNKYSLNNNNIAIIDNTNGISTPDLRSRFVLGAGQGYIKDDNKWEKNDKGQLEYQIDTITKKQISALKDWELLHPNWNESDSLTEEYIKLVKEITSPNEEETDRRKAVQIDNSNNVFWDNRETNTHTEYVKYTDNENSQKENKLAIIL